MSCASPAAAGGGSQASMHMAAAAQKSERASPHDEKRNANPCNTPLVAAQARKHPRRAAHQAKYQTMSGRRNWHHHVNMRTQAQLQLPARNVGTSFRSEAAPTAGASPNTHTLPCESAHSQHRILDPDTDRVASLPVYPHTSIANGTTRSDNGAAAETRRLPARACQRCSWPPGA